MGWSGSRAYLTANEWALRQHLPRPIAGLDADPNDANATAFAAAGFGEFAPFAQQQTASPPAAQAAPVSESTLAKIGRAVLDIVEGGAA